MEAAWRHRFRMQWPTPPNIQPDRPRKWTWKFEDERGNEFGRWAITGAGSTDQHIAAPELPLAYSCGIAIGSDFAIVGLATAQGYYLYHVRPGQPATLLYSHPNRLAVGAFLYSHSDRLAAGSLSSDEHLFCIQHSEHGDWYHPALRVFDIDGQPIADLWDGPGYGLWPGDWSPCADDLRLIFHHQRDDLLRPALWSPYPKTVVDIKLDLGGDVQASWYPDGTALILNHEYRGRHELYRYDLADGSLHRFDTPPGTIHMAGVQPDGQFWYLWDSGARPPELRNEAGVLSPAIGEAIPGAAYVDLDIDGIQAFLVEPVTPRPHPTLVLARCNMFDHIHDSYSPVIQSWVDHGFAVILPNYRGTMGFGRRWRDAVLDNPGLTELEDLAKVHDWIVSTGIADPDRIVLSGESWGGYLTLLGLGTQPERWAAGIANMPVGDFVAAYEDVMVPLQAMNRAQFGGAPSDVPEVYRRASPITYADQVQSPVMIIAGMQDPRCPYRQIENYVNRLHQLGKHCEMYLIDWGHFVWDIEERLRQAEAKIAFIARVLGTPMSR